MNLFQAIQEFHEKFELPAAESPKPLNAELFEFRKGFMHEELEEYCIAFLDEDLEGQLDALVDLVYVALGTAYMQGFDFNEAFRRVHEANMAKVRAKTADESKRGTAYDVVKPEGWTPPNLSDLVA